MNYYSYNGETGEYIGEINAAIDPLETKKQGYVVYLKPALTTDIAPPTTSGNEAVVFENGEWIIKEDYRGIEVYDINTLQPETIIEIGSIPVGTTEKIPLSEFYTWNAISEEWEIDSSKQWVDIRLQRDQLLLESDWTQLSDSPLHDEDKATWSVYRQDLRDIPQDYITVSGVVWPEPPTYSGSV